MLTIVSLFVLFAAACVFSFFEEKKNRMLVVAYAAAIVILVFIAGLRPIGIDGDSNNYLKVYYGNAEDFVEASFVLISQIVSYLFDEPQILFFIYALLSVPLKGVAVTRLSDLWFLSLALWLSRYFVLHDMTQIRVSVSAAIFLYSVTFLVKREKAKYLLCCLLATLFHYSSLALFPLVLLGNAPLSRLWKGFLAGVPILGFALYSLNINLVYLIPIPYIQDKLLIYELARETGIMGLDENINLFNPLYLIKLASFYLVLFKYDLLKEHVPALSLLLKVWALSFAAYSVLSFIPALAYRINELLAVVEIILIPYMVYTVRPVWVGRVAVLLFCGFQFYYTIYVLELLKFSV